ncbi:hypothetical protein BDZ45DRAFT_446456 [Acephala macrosclerotiorum]|nr:hypothetical protein BDZ45DRAFT_446456 [Acephala macrosclerotiorum]
MWKSAPFIKTSRQEEESKHVGETKADVPPRRQQMFMKNYSDLIYLFPCLCYSLHCIVIWCFPIAVRLSCMHSFLATSQVGSRGCHGPQMMLFVPLTFCHLECLPLPACIFLDPGVILVLDKRCSSVMPYHPNLRNERTRMAPKQEAKDCTIALAVSSDQIFGISMQWWAFDEA